jgi:hypothetical protein
MGTISSETPSSREIVSAARRVSADEWRDGM